MYPWEIVARALQLNAVKVVIFHNHPSGFLSQAAQINNLHRVYAAFWRSLTWFYGTTFWWLGIEWFPLTSNV